MYSKFIDHICFEFDTPDGRMKFYAQRAGSNIFRYARWVEPGTPIASMGCELSVFTGEMSALSEHGKRYELSNAYAISKEEFDSRFSNSSDIRYQYYIHVFNIDGKTYCIHSEYITNKDGRSYYQCINSRPLKGTSIGIEAEYSHIEGAERITGFKLTNGISSYAEYSKIKCSEEDFIMSFYTP